MMRTSGIVTLLTDFGYREPFAGVMKGVIAIEAPDAKVIDLTHGIPAHDVSAAGFWLERAFPYFPADTVHVAVVDPGVGGDRRALLARASGHWFVAPDNGLLTHVASTSAMTAYVMPVGKAASSTFQGRDVFARLAAKLVTAGVSEQALGDPVEDWVRLALPREERSENLIVGSIVACDQFGNLISNIQVPAKCRATRCQATHGVTLETVSIPIVSCYAEGRAGEPIALENAWRLIEIAVNRGDARTLLGLSKGARIGVEIEPV